MAFEIERAMTRHVLASSGRVGLAFFRSPEYRSAVAGDLVVLQRADEDAFFTAHQTPVAALQLGQYRLVVLLWEQILAVVKSVDPLRYQGLHKGTPFYWLGVASYLLEDYHRAVSYIDSAVAEDLHFDPARWVNLPAGLFLRLDIGSPLQAALPLVRHARASFEDVLLRIRSAGGVALGLDDLVKKLVSPAVATSPELRSAVSAMHTYMLEYETRHRQLELSSAHESSGEAIFLHLFSGAVLFETLLRTCSLGSSISGSSLNSYLTTPAIRAQLGLPSSFGGMGQVGLADVLAKTRAAAGKMPFNGRAVWTVWGLRNTVGHSLAWTPKPTPADHEELFTLTGAAVALVVDRLF
jgi:hypothetical protein